LQDASAEAQMSMDTKFIDSRPDPGQASASAEPRVLLKGALADLSPGNSLRF
jgi:hypothetical protein